MAIPLRTIGLHLYLSVVVVLLSLGQFPLDLPLFDEASGYLGRSLRWIHDGVTPHHTMSPAYSLAYVPVWSAAGPRHATVLMALLLRLGLANALLAWLRREHGPGPALFAALWAAAVPCVVAPQVGVSLATALLVVVTAGLLLASGRGGWSVALAVVASAWLALLRPELTPLPLLVAGAGGVSWWRARRGPSTGSGGRPIRQIVATGLLAAALVGFGVSYAAFHAPDPHRSEWALRGAYHKIGDFDATFPGATSVAGAARANPAAMARHVANNVPRLGRQAHALLGLAPLRPRPLAWLAAAVVMALCVLGARQLWGRGWKPWGGPAGAALVFGVAAGTLAAALLIEPVPRYFAPLVPALAPLFAAAAGAATPRWKRLSPPVRQALVAIALLLPPLLLARPAIHHPRQTPMPVRDILDHGAAGLTAPATIHGHAAGSFAVYLGADDWTVRETYDCPDPAFLTAERPAFVIYAADTCGAPFQTWSARTTAIDGYLCRASGPLVGCRLREDR